MAPAAADGDGVSAEEGSTTDYGLKDSKNQSSRSVLGRAFVSCEGDPRGSVHRAWGFTLLFLAIFFVLAFIEASNLEKDGSSTSHALTVAAGWTAFVHLVVAIVGTFVLKRFPTSFSVGFFLGLVVVASQQNLVLFATFHNFPHGTPSKNHLFADLALSLSLILIFFAAMLGHFREHVLLAPVDVKGLRRGRGGSSSVGDESLAT